VRNFSICLVSLCAIGVAFADGPYKAEPYVFVGSAAACGGPAGSPTVTAAWQPGIGLPDAGKSAHGMLLQKLGPTANCAAAGAAIDGVTGIQLTSIGYDIRSDGHCGAGAPRFNVTATDGFHFLGGCANATRTPDTPATGWTRVRIDPTNPAQAFPPIASGATIISISVLFDEGQDTLLPGAGTAIIDNIQIKTPSAEVLIGKPGNAN
jgi:hypothetical protein